MPTITHKMIKKIGLSEMYLELKDHFDALEAENVLLRNNNENFELLISAQDKEIKKLTAALKKADKKIYDLENPKIWMNDGEL